ncbi:hypothetical protein [Streptomyces sp. NPDC088348]|uniref:hypothetical protein n=1 Tax=Streptomyces sp. NPDC088348 TaxID=3365853 RepID=UPI00381D1A44
MTTNHVDWLCPSDPFGHQWAADKQHCTGCDHVRPASPDGCRWCGTDRSAHGRRYVESRGVHAWEPPTNAQRLARMHARRNTTKEN